ncbi:DUF2064 domain-containing protein [Cnuibacter physcomitrellae]|uniref:TIGR04282 family arsenosugar biosynthesis glycosyltransferase n=1 Tax=Cnuibacter physcomitrellae TaxID=1619308 RepID=UPI002175E442|nr:DUF2064 domain-containing protein [Cnuibacter physcomitrellae]MCS5498605.1 DUF2064 domain-containing protein [Cnuibacter physcomitrellae]
MQEFIEEVAVVAAVVIAKECVPGRVKTRLNPPLSLEQAAEVAAASLADTVDVITSLPFTRRILAYAGENAPVSADWEVLPQTTGTLDLRLGDVFDAVGEPMVLIGMDTPQVSARHLVPLLRGWPDDADSVFGPALDGGFWALGMREPDGDLIRGVPMSQDFTGRAQLARLRAAGHRVRMLPELDDVDTVDDALRIAAEAPRTRFAGALRGALGEIGVVEIPVTA